MTHRRRRNDDAFWIAKKLHPLRCLVPRKRSDVASGGGGGAGRGGFGGVVWKRRRTVEGWESSHEESAANDVVDWRAESGRKRGRAEVANGQVAL